MGQGLRQQPQQQHLQPEAGLHAVAQLLLAALELCLPLQQARLADRPSHPRKFWPQRRRHAGEFQPIRRHARQQQIPQQPGQALQHGGGFAAPLQQLPAGLNHPQRLGFGHGPGQQEQFLFRYRPQQFPHGQGLDRSGQQAELIQQAFGVAQAALGPLGHHLQGLGGDADRFLGGDPGEVLFQGLQGDAAEIEALAAREDRGQHPLGIGGGQHEHHPRRRLLQGLEQGVEGGGGEHVALVHHVDLPAGLHRCEAGALDQLADVVDAGVGGGINFDHVEGIADGDRGAEFTGAAGLGCRPFAGHAVERAGQDAGAGGLARTAGPTKQVGRGDPPGAQGIAQGGGDGLLPHQLRKPLGAVFVVEGLVGGSHGGIVA